MPARLSTRLSPTPQSAVISRERLIVGSSIFAITALSWLYMVPTARDMYGEMTGSAAWMMADTWDAPYTFLIFLMWAVMMAGMMLPSATPTIMTFATVVRRRPEPEAPVARTLAFGAGYLVAWTAFSVAATALQWLLARTSLLSPMMESASAAMTGAILVLAGAYQWTPLKHACLDRCRSPLIYLVRAWRPGRMGALRMGMRHGLECIGCCWALMLLLFAAGVMSLVAIASITVFVLAEKVAPFGKHGAFVSGAVLVLLGLWVLVAAPVGSHPV
jgi:predicted metal-binding membrane protein